MTTTPSFADRVASVPCPTCAVAVDVADVEPLSTIVCPACRSTFTVPGVVGSLVLKRLLGRGTAGVVYHAYDHELGRDVAVKVFLKSGHDGADVDVIEKCLTEARAMRALTHPNIVQIYKVAQKGERPFIIMELLTGDRLDKVIDDNLLVEEHRALRMAIDIAGGLKAVHDAGFAHLDVKPANIQMTGDGVCKLLDYDTARSQRQIEEQGAGLVGTPYYVAPEIIRRGAVDFRADMYSLGATLFHLIAQRPPFQGETSRDVVQERLKRRAIDLHAIRPDVSQRTSAIIARMLEPEPDDRYATYDELLADLRAAQQQAVASAISAPVAGRPGAARKPLSHSTIAAGAGVAVVLIAFFVWFATRPADREGKDGLGKERIALNSGNSDGTAAKDAAAVTPVIIDPPVKESGKDNAKDQAKDGQNPVVPVVPAPPIDKTRPDPVKPPPDPVTPPVKTEPPAPPLKRDEKEVDGWFAGKDVTLTHKPNLLTVWSTGTEPSIRIAGLKGPGDSPEPCIVEIRLKASGEGQGKVWWLSEKFPLFSDTRVKPIALKHDGEWHDYILPVHAKGSTLELRLDFGSAAGIFEIQWIKFYANGATDTRPTQQWRFEQR
jgi:hypothetical protein